MWRRLWRWLFPVEQCPDCGTEYRDDRWHTNSLTHYVACTRPRVMRERQARIDADPALAPKSLYRKEG